MLFGSQRLISPLDWANTRRTFEGIRTTVKAGDWTADGFWTAFVPVNPSDLDTADWKQQFYGVYATYAGLKNVNLDTYYIGYDDRRAGPNADFSLHTLGARLWGTTQNDWLWEVEGGPQFGRQSGLGLDHDAGFCTVGMGRKLADMPWSPTLWFYYDYASGNHGAGDFNRFNHLFPLAHKYLGFIDAVQRSNIQSPNVLLTMQPTKKLGLLCWYYHFQADSATDIVPSVGGTPTQNNVKDFGDELDILATINLNARTEVWIGWSHLWRGDKIVGTNDADFFYSQWQLNF
ncbi:MAG: alginate export family protein [Planctomycetales bacterium]|nr:alginate export family protein [Planctomycetales bacterium]